MDSQSCRFPYHIVIIYFLAGVAWIFFSDLAMEHFAPAAYKEYFSIAKGWLFIVVTAALLALMLHRYHTSRLALERRLREIVDHLPSVLYVFDHDGRALLLNRAMKALCNDNALDPRGKTREELGLAPEAAAEHRNNDLRVMESGEPLLLEEHNQQADGCHTYLTVKFPLTALDGTIEAVCGVSTDISERKEAERTLLEALAEAQRFREALDHVPAFIYMKDSQSRYVYGNRPTLELFGCSADELVGADDSRFFPPDTAKQLREVDSQVFAGQQTAEEIQVADAEGGERIYWEIKTPIFIAPEQRTAWGLLGISTDITERKRGEEALRAYRDKLEDLVADRTRELEETKLALMNIVEDLSLKSEELAATNERLQDVDRLKSLFIASMSHELRTPLNSIIGFSSILLNEWLGPLNEEQRNNLGTVLKAGRHLLTLINDVIDISKVEAGQVEISVEEFDLYDLCTEAAGLLADEARDKGLLFTLEPLHHPMRTDRRRLLQCLLNLISNAVKYTETGTVSVRALLEQQEPGSAGRVLLVVADTGIGIAPHDRTKLFVPFVRLESPLKGQVPGSGLGLYLTRKIARIALEGDVQYHDNEGRGSIFTLTVPDSRSQQEPMPSTGVLP
jgi:PAS domain S-box-containing protein